MSLTHLYANFQVYNFNIHVFGKNEKKYATTGNRTFSLECHVEIPTIDFGKKSAILDLP
eukprot:TRINITY_DN3303_c0_g1_i1.p2 TRINITY_DN3303_c0_g1~~TRINITY_DN3303_c0_g1_i1.p2  ORF type:complete len:59 (+),score=7.00 TRINITY_DN3303_c0_g1_i1:341-517(+)